jgi:glucose 1-dehydrogenase/3-oxoacyl-[acyl-carrier protein] reductase
VDVDHVRAKETADSIAESGGQALALAADVRDREAVAAALEATATEWQRFDYLVNNAGLITMSSLEDLTDDEWDLVLDVNLKGVYITTQLAIPYFRKANRGAVVNLSTVEADVVVSSQGFAQVHYNASKGGVKMLTKALAVELSRYNVRVNAIAPGPVPTNFLPGVDLNSPEVLAVMDSRLLVKRLGKPEDMAAAVSFLLSDDASYISGAQFPVDGGWLTR